MVQRHAPTRITRVAGVLCLALGVGGCGNRSQAQSEDSARELATKVIPSVERAVGLKFKSAPEIAVRSKQQFYAYLQAKMDAELPPEEMEQVARAYRIFGLIPDTLELRDLLLELYAEQVVGFYDPDSAALYVVAEADRFTLRVTLAHELVHALQDQYMSLAPILSAKRQNDRHLAAQAVLEGQATLASLIALKPDLDPEALGGFWTDYAASVRAQQEQMPVFRSAPLIIREGLIFPYLAGADFVRWFKRQYPDTVPYGERLPESTEQILHPDRYRMGDAPTALIMRDTVGVVYSDGLGEFETRILLTVLSGSATLASAGASGWAGDRYAVFEAGGDHAIVWWSVWDDDRQAKQFATILEREWTKRAESGRRHSVERLDVGTMPGVLFVDGPVDWGRWGSIPKVVIASKSTDLKG
ncbi:MAG: hypothetical protein ACE5HT_12550 [Gemmatimonadales bacterium]